MGMVNYLSFINLVVDVPTLLSSPGTVSPPPVHHHMSRPTKAIAARPTPTISPVATAPTLKASLPLDKRPASAPVRTGAPRAVHSSSQPVLAYTPKGSGRTGSSSYRTRDGSKKFNVSYAPEAFSNEFYHEDEDNYKDSTTISGRGVVGASFTDVSKREKMARVNLPRTQQVQDDVLGGNLSASQASYTASVFPRSRSAFLSEFDDVAVKALNTELGDAMSSRIGSVPGVSMRNLLLQYLQQEDTNRSNTLKVHNIKAVLQNVGVAYHFLASESQKRLINTLVKHGRDGEIYIKDFMKLIYLS